MRITFAVPLLMLAAVPGFAQPGPEHTTLPTAAAEDRSRAGWADWEAQSRIIEGDYDGAVQAEQQAAAVRHEADRQDMLARASK